MFWTQGRFSWPAIIVVLYSTLVIFATDLVWRLVTAPVARIAGGALVVLLVGNALILALSRRARR